MWQPPTDEHGRSPEQRPGSTGEPAAGAPSLTGDAAPPAPGSEFEAPDVSEQAAVPPSTPPHPHGDPTPQQFAQPTPQQFPHPAPPQQQFPHPAPPQQQFPHPSPPQQQFPQPPPPQQQFPQPAPPQQQFPQPTPQQFAQPTPPQQQFAQPTPPQQFAHPPYHQQQQPQWSGTPMPAPPVRQGAPAGQSVYGNRAGPPPQQQGGYGQFNFPAATRQPLEPVAVAGVATSVLGPVGIVLGLLARARIRRNRKRSPGLAWTAVALGALFTVAWALTGTVLLSNGTFAQAFQSPQPGDADEQRTVFSINLAEGNCVRTLPPAEVVGEVDVVPCGDSHAAQVVSVEQQTGGYPGAAELDQRAAEVCTQAAEHIVDGGAEVLPWYLVPSDIGWEQGNTQIICMVRSSAGPVQDDYVN